MLELFSIADDNKNGFLEEAELSKHYSRISMHDTIAEIFWYRHELNLDDLSAKMHDEF